MRAADQYITEKLGTLSTDPEHEHFETLKRKAAEIVDQNDDKRKCSLPGVWRKFTVKSVDLPSVQPTA